MGRIFEKRKDRMFARWSKASKAFTKVGKEIAIAVKLSGTDPDSNPRLRMAIQTARSLNMPKDRIESAIHRAGSKDEASLQEVIYEGYGPHGIAIIVLTATDNPTRTVANVRGNFTHNGGSLGTTGSLAFLFDKRGAFTIAPPSQDFDELELELIDFGLEDAFETDEGILLYSSFEQFGILQKALEEKKIDVKSAGVVYLPKNQISLNEAQIKEVEDLISKLEDDDDVQHVYSTLSNS